MNISRLVEKIFIRLFLIVILFPLQSCSNTLIGEKLENSFDIVENPKISEKTNNKPQQINEKIKIKSRNKDDKKENENDFGKIIKENSMSKKNSLSQKSTKSINKTIFKDADDKSFGWNLYKKTTENELDYENLISQYTPDWETERIAIIDNILLKMCISELKFFQNVPVNVSLNEYVEISKDYSSPKSSAFINGILNNIMRDLKGKGLIKKNIKRSDNLLNLDT